MGGRVSILVVKDCRVYEGRCEVVRLLGRLELIFGKFES